MFNIGNTLNEISDANLRSFAQGSQIARSSRHFFPLKTNAGPKLAVDFSLPNILCFLPNSGIFEWEKVTK